MKFKLQISFQNNKPIFSPDEKKLNICFLTLLLSKEGIQFDSQFECIFKTSILDKIKMIPMRRIIFLKTNYYEH